MKLSFKKLFNSQWSYMYAGIAVGLAQVIYMIGLWVSASNAGKTPTTKPITVTTDLGKMFRAMEVFINNLFDFKTELYGKYGTIMVDGVETILPATGGAFIPGVGWPIVGMIVGGYLVAKMERESRGWAYYSKKALLVSFFGGAFFSYGTRLGGGCTLNHLMGGVPMMNIHSIVTALFMAMGGALGFVIMAKLGLANYFKHQETKAYVIANKDKGEQATYKEGYKPTKTIIYWVALTFSLVFVFVAVYNGFFSADSMEHIKVGKGDAASKIVAFNKSVDHKGWFYVIITLVAGIIGGIGMAKSGFGTECSLVAAETGADMAKNDEKYAKMGVPKITRTLMRSYAPIIGIATHWVVMLAFILIAWIVMGVNPGFSGGVKYSLTAGSFIGGLLLGIGAVTLIGCEIRSYMRLGLGYVNTMVGFMGFAFGYLPFTLMFKGHKNFLSSTVIAGENGSLTDSFKVYELFSDSETVQQIILVLWWVFLVWLTYYFIKKGMKNTGLKKVHMIHANIEEVQNYIDTEAAANNGKVNGVDAPMPVPPDAYAEQ